MKCRDCKFFEMEGPLEIRSGYYAKAADGFSAVHVESPEYSIYPRQGKCRRYAPRIYTGERNLSPFRWPWTSEKEWCGEFKPRIEIERGAIRRLKDELQMAHDASEHYRERAIRDRQNLKEVEKHLETINETSSRAIESWKNKVRELEGKLHSLGVSDVH